MLVDGADDIGAMLRAADHRTFARDGVGSRWKHSALIEQLDLGVEGQGDEDEEIQLERGGHGRMNEATVVSAV